MNLGKIEGDSRIGGILGSANRTENNTSKIINCYNIGDLSGKNYIGEILGDKENTGTHYINKCYGEDRGKPLYNKSYTGNDGDLEVTDCSLYTKEYMKTEAFLKILNDYVTEYNRGEKEESGSKELIQWNFDEKTGYPTLTW